MNILDTPVADLTIVRSVPHRDARGTFLRLFCAQELQPVLGHRQIAQINHSKTSHARAVRGMHFQRLPHAEMKMIRCLRGRVWDVAVDLRAGSPTFLQWHAEELAQDDAQMLVIQKDSPTASRLWSPTASCYTCTRRSTTHLPRAGCPTTTPGSPSPGHCRHRTFHLVICPTHCWTPTS
jgi:hypothetical protein